MRDPSERYGAIEVVFDDDDASDEVFDLKEAFDLPDRLPPIRLPSEPELAEAARASQLLDRANRLARWAVERRPVLDYGELTAADSDAAARALGMEVPDRSPRDDTLPGMPAAPAVRAMTDLPELVQLWALAEELEFVEIDDDGRATAGPGLAEWPDGTDEEVLETWDHALADTLERTLALAADLAERADLDFVGAGPIASLMLFLVRGDGISLDDLGDLIRETATAGLSPAAAQRAWRSFAKRQGDPASLLVARLAEHGAVTMEGGVVRLTPLSSHAMRLQMLDSGVDVPLLPAVEEMTAADLVEVGKTASEAELAAESAAWLASRDPQSAVDELLEVAAAGGPAERVFAASIAASVGSDVEATWRRALDQPRLRPYAIMALGQLAGGDPDEVLPGLEPSLADVAWLLTDTVAALAESPEPEEAIRELDLELSAGQEEQVFEEVRRLDHPYAYTALAAIGKYYPDERVAKSARRSAAKLRPSVKRK